MRVRSAILFAAIGCAFAALPVYADTSSDQQAALEADLAQVQAQIQVNQAKLTAEQAQRTTLQNQVAILDSQIQEAQLEIKQRNLTIQQLKDGIADNQAGIAVLDSKVSAGQASLAQILRETQQIDETSFAEQILNGSLTGAFQDLDDFQTIQSALGSAFTQMAAQRSDLSAREQSLQDQESQASQLLQLQVVQQASLKATEQQKQNLVTAAKGQESVYLQLIAGQQKTAAQIQSELFTLRDTSSISFGSMYTYAQAASAATNVAPAFILAILTEESNLGQDVGSCTYLEAMSPNRDIPVYLKLMQQLGLDPNSEKVSCAQSYGAYGGAMGPAQFIPSTWALYQNRIAQATGQNPPNPWDPRTATFATAIYMSDLGADAQTPAAERQAALRYLAGSHWKSSAYAFYGNSVMCYTNQIQQEINVLNGAANPGSAISCS